MESFAGADLHKRVTQLAVLRKGQPPSQFRFPNDPNTVQGGLRKLPRGTKIAVEATGSWWWFIEKARELDHEISLSQWQRHCAGRKSRGSRVKTVSAAGCRHKVRRSSRVHRDYLYCCP